MSLWVSLMQAPSEITLQKILFGLFENTNVGRWNLYDFLWSGFSNKCLVKNFMHCRHLQFLKLLKTRDR